MRSILNMDNIQIEWTTRCTRACSNCTRFVGHKPAWDMSFDQFQEAIDSMDGYQRIVGAMGGDPILHPEFERFCEYQRKKIPKEKSGLWTCLPKGKEHYRETIAKTFGHVFINDHTRNDIYHAPILVSAEEVIPNKQQMFHAIDQCWLQNSWSASVNPNGAFFCEIAAAMSLLFEDSPKGWPVEPGWWWRTPKDFTEQIEFFCPRCGVAMPLPRRQSTDGRDDISPMNLARLKGRSKKIDKGQYVLSNCQPVPAPALEKMAAYKDMEYRQRIADSYGMFLMPNQHGFLTPMLKKNFDVNEERVYKPSLFEQYQTL